MRLTLYQALTSNRRYITKSSAPLCWLPNSHQILKRWARALERGCMVALMCTCANVCHCVCKTLHSRVDPEGQWINLQSSPLYVALYHSQLPQKNGVSERLGMKGKNWVGCWLQAPCQQSRWAASDGLSINSGPYVPQVICTVIDSSTTNLPNSLDVLKSSGEITLKS